MEACAAKMEEKHIDGYSQTTFLNDTRIRRLFGLKEKHLKELFSGAFLCLLFKVFCRATIIGFCIYAKNGSMSKRKKKMAYVFL